MNEMMIFSNPEFGNVRTVTIDGNPWFVGNDVAKALGYSNPQKAVREHCKGVNVLGTPSAKGLQLTKFITEADIYRLVMRSKLPAAETFQDWVV